MNNSLLFSRSVNADIMFNSIAEHMANVYEMEPVSCLWCDGFGRIIDKERLHYKHRRTRKFHFKQVPARGCEYKMVKMWKIFCSILLFLCCALHDMFMCRWIFGKKIWIWWSKKKMFIFHLIPAIKLFSSFSLCSVSFFFAIFFCPENSIRIHFEAFTWMTNDGVAIT